MAFSAATRAHRLGHGGGRRRRKCSGAGAPSAGLGPRGDRSGLPGSRPPAYRQGHQQGLRGRAAPCALGLRAGVPDLVLGAPFARPPGPVPQLLHPAKAPALGAGGQRPYRRVHLPYRHPGTGRPAAAGATAPALAPAGRPAGAGGQLHNRLRLPPLLGPPRGRPQLGRPPLDGGRCGPAHGPAERAVRSVGAPSSSPPGPGGRRSGPSSACASAT